MKVRKFDFNKDFIVYHRYNSNTNDYEVVRLTDGGFFNDNLPRNISEEEARKYCKEVNSLNGHSDIDVIVAVSQSMFM